MESRPPSFSPHSLISVQVQHQRTGVAMTPQAVWVLLTDTWLCPLEWKTGVTTYNLCKNNAVEEDSMADITWELLCFSINNDFLLLRNKSDYSNIMANRIRRNLNLLLTFGSTQYRPKKSLLFSTSFHLKLFQDSTQWYSSFINEVNELSDFLPLCSQSRQSWHVITHIFMPEAVSQSAINFFKSMESHSVLQPSYKL